VQLINHIGAPMPENFMEHLDYATPSSQNPIEKPRHEGNLDSDLILDENSSHSQSQSSMNFHAEPVGVSSTQISHGKYKYKSF
jgi:hypothetical protein